MMQVGLIGLSKSGITTLFQILSGNSGIAIPGKANRAVVKVPDKRVEYLSKIFKPQKTTFAALEAIDIPGLVPGADKSATSFLQAVREVDILVQVIRDFNNEEVPHIEGELNPIRDLEAVNYELLLADLDQIQKRLDRIFNGKGTKRNETEIQLLNKLKDCLEYEKTISSLELNEEELLLVRNYQFLTAKPCVVIINVDEESISQDNHPRSQPVVEYCRERSIPVHLLSAKIEHEISQLNEEERQLFMEDMGITESSLSAVTRVIYHKLGLISFFTVGQDEVKAWTINKGTNARKGAGKIHSDMERGFIRAEVIAYDSFVKAGSMANAKNEGSLRLEGKEYIIKDGDIVHFRFNV